MADKDVEYWFTTENGAHIPVKRGQSKEQALNEFLKGKGDARGKSVDELKKEQSIKLEQPEYTVKKVEEPKNRTKYQEASESLKSDIKNGTISYNDIVSDERYKTIQNYANSLPETYFDNSPEREEFRRMTGERYFNEIKAYNPVTKKYDGEIKKERIAHIAIGLPAAGKSSTLANPISAEIGARILDNDEVKKMIPEWDEGIGAGAVHEESSQILEERVMQKVLADGENVIIPKIGSKIGSIEKLTKQLKDAGYTVHLDYNEVPNSVSLERGIKRWVKEGRFLSPKLIKDYGDKPDAVYEELKKSGKYASYRKVDNSGTQGKLIEYIK